MASPLTPARIIRSATGSMDDHQRRLLTEIDRAESTLRDLREDAARGNFTTSTSLASQTADILARLTRLNLMTEINGALIGGGMIPEER